MAKRELIKIKFLNTCDGNDEVYSNGFYFEEYLDGVMGQPTYEHEENANENNEKEIEFTRKVMKKYINFVTFGDEHKADVLNKIRLADYKILISKANETYVINEMEVEGDLEQGVNILKIN
jgi:hypothetical protein